MPRGIFTNPKKRSENLSHALKGKHCTPKTEFKKGHKHSPSIIEKLRKASLGKKQSPELIEKRFLWRKDSKKMEGVREKMSKALKGNKCYAWKGGITPINRIIRHSFEYRLWREAVFKRDNYTCIWCGQRGGKLNADHIKPFAYFPELRFAIDNGRTLCIDCHRKTDTFGEKAKNYHVK